MSADEARQMIGVSRSTLGRMERAETTIMPAVVEKMLRLYGVEEEDIEPLVELAKQARKRGWWQRYNDVLPDWFEVYVGLEAEASLISEYDPALIPGILQTEDYARTVIKAEHPNETSKEIERRAELRMQRQQREQMPKLWMIVDEAVLRRTVGSRDIMRQQLQHVLQVAEQPGNDIQVLPFDAGEHGSMGVAFSILSFPDPRDAPMVYLENQVSSLYLEEDHEVQRYREVFEHLKATATSIRKSDEMIFRVMNDL
jgi:hypothetical protein